MKERPILFQGAMVRAMLAGTKTQTRRVMKYQPGDETTVHVEAFNQTVVGRHGEEQPGREVFGAWWDDGESGLRCPHGAPGDQLWVREAWSTHACFDAVPPRELTTRSIHYRADGDCQTGKYRPPMFMPRWASRVQLEVTEVRVERLQDISEADAIAEGCITEEIVTDYDASLIRVPAEIPHPSGIGTQGWDTARDWYADLWESINGAGSWDLNPWVWAVSFKRVNTDERSAAPTPLTGARKPNVPDPAPAPSLEGVRNA